MHTAGIRKRVDTVKLFAFARRHRRVGDKLFIIVIFDNRLARNGIGIFVLNAEGFGVKLFGGFKVVIIKFACDIEMYAFTLFAEVDRAADIADFFHRNASIKKLCDAKYYFFAHTIGENISARVYEDTAANLIIPIIVVSVASERGFEAADYNRYIAECFAYTVTIDDNGAVGAFAHNSAGRIIVIGSFFTRDGIVCDHGVDIACADQKTKARARIFHKGVSAFIIGLGEDSDSEACVLKHAGDYSSAETGVIDVSVAGDINEVGAIPATFFHIGAAKRKKALFYSGSYHYIIYIR